MGKIKVSSCETDGMVIEGLHVIEPTVFNDERGYFMETYNQNDFKEAGLNMVFVQDNQSMSVKGVLRGLHFQKQFPQGKLVRAVRGTVFDVAVDLEHTPRHTASGSALSFLRRIRNNSIFRKALPTALSFFPMKQSLLTSAPISTIRVTRVDLHGTMRRSA